ncbi:nuclear transport factor 2 family protein [Novosphingobium sp. PS1R-30]|uniref:Nuclear transport factor 2 family protein n=1 Tax=Novosphingobium anseongense TaxID=3133436 RepID=A0ABU8S2D9_9SPHN
MAQSRMIVPGGELDPAHPGSDVFLRAPREPSVPPGRACEVARRYVELINAGDYAGVAALYADDATFLEPMRPTLHGRAQIDEFYAKRIGAMKPRIVAVSYLGGEEECMVSLALRTAIGGEERFVLVSVDHFLVNAQGRIVSMIAFARPPRAG